MDWIGFRRRAASALGKYRYVALVLLAGLFLMCLPAGGGAEEASPEPTAAQPSLQKELEELLGALAGAGQVEVLLTQAAGEEVLYQTDEDRSAQTDATDLRRETVLVTDTDRAQTGLVRQVLAPSYRGAVVLCQGADNAAVRLSIVEAVASATGLTTDKITVLKMK